MSGPLTAGRATVPVSGWVRPMTASACAIRASALLVGGAPVWIALQCRYSESVSRQEGSHDDSHVFFVQDRAVGTTFVAAAPSAIHKRDAGCVRSRFVRTGPSAKTVRDASCMSGPLTTGRATVPVSGWIRPPVSSAHAIRSSAPSSHRSSTAPVCLSAQCRDGESLLHGFFRSERSCNFFGIELKQMPVFLDLAIRYGYVVRSRFVAAASSANRERGAGCVRSRSVRTGPSAKTVRDASCKSGPLTAGRAAVPVSGWVRPTLRRVQAAMRDAVIRSSGGARWTWASPDMTEPSLLVGMLQPPSPAPSPPAGHSMRRLQGGSRIAFRPHLEAAGDVKNTPSSWGASVSKPSRFLTCPFLAQSTIAAVVRLCPVRAVRFLAPEYCLIGFGLDHQRPKKESSHWST